MAAVTIHGRTRAQGYTGLADWDVIGQVADAIAIPVIGNGDVATGADVEVRRAQTRVRGIMIGRAAMTNPWVFQEARHYLNHGVQPDPVPAETRLAFMRRHCVLAIAHSTRGGEFEVIRAMRSRLMHYTRSLPSGKFLRNQFASVGSLAQLDDISAAYLDHRTRIEDDSLPLPS
jgi:tRNA-dihydrouridine synthase